MPTMQEYVQECVNERLISVDVSLVALDFYDRFKEKYPNLEFDACPTSKGFLMALDDGIHYREFEYFENKWEFFYKNRKTMELYDCDIIDFDFEKVDEYIQRGSCK